MRTKKTKEAVSLIVLVLTIVIMIILAGVIVINLNNSGIIDRAKGAVSETNLKNMQELANVAWGEAYLAIKGEKTPDAIKTLMLEKLKGKGVSEEELAKYTFTVTTGGVEVVVNDGSNTPEQPEAEQATGWKKEGFKVVKGNQELEIGDVVDYTATGSEYTGEWKVLGADDDGNLLIMSANNVDSVYFNEPYDLYGGQDDWLNGADQLDEVCQAYGNGDNAIDVRSIRIEDIDSVTGYDKTEYGEGELYQYGNEVTYSYNNSLYPAYYSDVTGEGELEADWEEEQIIMDEDNYFHFYDYDSKEFVVIDDLESGEEGTSFAKLTNNYYDYSLRDDEITEKAALMIFEEYDEEIGADVACYWLASPYVRTNTYYAAFGISLVLGNDITGQDLWYSCGWNWDISDYGVRAVVTLSKDINFTDYTESDGWIY